MFICRHCQAGPPVNDSGMEEVINCYGNSDPDNPWYPHRLADSRPSVECPASGEQSILSNDKNTANGAGSVSGTRTEAGGGFRPENQ